MSERVSEMTDDEIRELAAAVPEGIRSAADVVVSPEDLRAIREALEAALRQGSVEAVTDLTKRRYP